MIKQIDKSSVQKICTGQVVVDLASATKEMIENSLDAGARHIEVKFKNFGFDSIEVSDDGYGISPSNYENIALKSFTSKINNFNDLSGIVSFGFRGEALNALCELSSNFQVITKQSSQDIGNLLTFEKNGRIKEVSQTARSTGTTILVEGLFESLPVRRSEFRRSMKKQFQKAIKILQAYALISTGVKIIVSNSSNSSKQILIATQSKNSVLDNISAIYGSKFATSLTPLEFEIPAETLIHGKYPSSQNEVDNKSNSEVESEVLTSNESSQIMTSDDDFFNFGLLSANSATNSQSKVSSQSQTHGNDGIDLNEEDFIGKIISIKGYVSKCGVGVGRSDNDRQFLYCNCRPVDLPKFTRALNEVWRRYEMKQKPAFLVNVILPPQFMDVNLAPDKREVAIVNEDLIIELLKETIIKIYEPSRYTFQVSQGLPKSLVETQSYLSQRPSNDEGDFSQNSKQISMTQFITNNLDLSSESKDTKTVIRKVKIDQLTTPTSLRDIFSSGRLTEIFKMDPSSTNTTIKEEDYFANKDSEMILSEDIKNSYSINLPKENDPNSESRIIRDVRLDSNNRISHQDEFFNDTPQKERPRPDMSPGFNAKEVTWVTKNEEQYLSKDRVKELKDPIVDPSSLVSNSGENESNQDTFSATMNPISKGQATTVEWRFNPDEALSGFIQNKKARIESNVKANKNKILEVNPIPGEDQIATFQSKVSRRGNSRVLSKNDFQKMRVLGQFNLGFIIAEFNGDIYILDQHACDEKYRFENFQKSTQVHTQPLISPLFIETSAAQEIIISENLEIFEANGFKIQFDPDGHAGKRLKLLSIPFSKTSKFGVDDVNELASMIGEQDSFDNAINQRVDKNYLLLKNDKVSIDSESQSSAFSSSKHRLPKLISMFASKACRTAVMIGTALKKSEMKSIVKNLTGLEQPWNCPHGRPTIRHLADFENIANDVCNA